MKLDTNKKVLLRERKRHTSRRVASARYGDLSPDGGGGVPHPVLDGGRYPILLTGGTPIQSHWIPQGTPPS